MSRWRDVKHGDHLPFQWTVVRMRRLYRKFSERKKMNDIDVLNRVTEMCIESASPDQMESWEKLQMHLLKTRKSLHKLLYAPYETIENPDDLDDLRVKVSDFQKTMDGLMPLLSFLSGYYGVTISRK
jgi:hypothetical protein